MPVTQSAKKALRRDRRRAVVNLKTKARVKATIKKFKKASTQKNLSLAYSLVDRAAKKGVFHKNKSARIKSRLAKKLKSAGSR